MIRSLQDLIVQHRASINAQSNKISGKGLSLRQGDVVTGKVLDFQPSGQAKLLVQGKELSAQTTVKLAKGQMAQFRVEQTQPHYVFKVSSGSAGMQHSAMQMMGSVMQASPFQIFNDIFQLFKKNPDDTNQKIMMQMMQLFSQLAIKPGDSITPYYLMAFLQRSGLLWENKMKQWLSSQKNRSSERFNKLIQQDLKALAFETANNINSNPEIKQGMEQVIEKIEQWQLLNHKLLKDHGKMYFMLPLLFDTIFHSGELMIDISDMKKGGKEPKNAMLKAALLLKMTRIGPVKVEAVLFQRQLRIDYWLCHHETIALFKQNESLVADALRTHGVQIQMIAYHLEDNDTLNEMSLLDDISRSSQRLSTFA